MFRVALYIRTLFCHYFSFSVVPSLSRGKSRLGTLRRLMASTEKYVLADPRRHRRLTMSTKPGTRHYGDKQCRGPTGRVVPEVPITFCFAQSRCIDTDTRFYTFINAKTKLFFISFSYISNIILLSSCPIRVRRVRIQGAPDTLFPNSNLLLKFKQTITIPIPYHSVYVARPTQRVFIKFPFSFSRNYDQFSQLIAQLVTNFESSIAINCHARLFRLRDSCWAWKKSTKEHEKDLDYLRRVTTLFLGENSLPIGLLCIFQTSRFKQRTRHSEWRIRAPRDRV